jgi:hypothetical protein
MKRMLVLALSLFLPLPATAQVNGLHVEGGVVLLTHAGSFTFGTSEIDSDAGYAFRGRVRYGLGIVSVAAEVQETSQNYGMPPNASAPQDLNNTFVGATAAIHPFKLVGIVPYGEIGLGKMFFGDSHISTDQGSTASIYGLGVGLGTSGRIGLDVGLRLQRLGNLTATGISSGFDYNPLLFHVMLSIKL